MFKEKNEIRAQKLIRKAGLFIFIFTPIYAFGWKYYTNYILEKGIHQDFKRMKDKGKTLADIPRKND